jgi:hypothetical protein
VIIKSLSRKTASFGALIEYINQPEKRAGHPTFHNLKAISDDPKAINKEFLENFRYCPMRKNGVLLFHEILSFSGKDTNELNPKIINDLVKKYLELRAPEALAYSKIHFDTDCPHAHLMLSGNLKQSAQKLRLSKREFEQVKIELERYQKKKYPFLENSVVFGEVRGKKKTGKARAEREMERRHQKKASPPKTQKEQVVEAIRSALVGSYSKNQFIEALKIRGFDFYERGDTNGVKETASKRKYRFKTLGLDGLYLETMKRWQKASERSRDIKEIITSKVKSLWRKMGFKEDILETITDISAGQPKKQQIKLILKKKRQYERSLPLKEI